MFQSRSWVGKWMILGYVLSSSLFAQSFFTTPPGTNFNSSQGNAVPKPSPSPVLTPAEYQSQVNTLHEQSMNNLQSKYQQQYKSNPSQSISTGAPPAPPPPPDTSISNAPTQNTMPMQSPPPGMMATPPSSTSQPAAPAAPLPAPPAAPGQQNGGGGGGGSPYTGFGGGGGGSTGGSKAPASGGGGGGWNIKY